MNNLLIYGDLHICQSSLKECITILEEIGMLANKYNCDTLINLGDTFDNIKPSSKELDVFATFIRRLDNKQHIILAADSHESETQEQSILNHYGILSDNVKVVKEFKDGNHLFCGHFYLKESKINYGAKMSRLDIKDYFYVFLGHIHSYSLIKPNIVHLGSARYVDFAEAQDKAKIVALITDYGTEKENVHFLKLKSPIPMQEFILNSNKINGLEKNDPKNSHLLAHSEAILSKNDRPILTTKKGKSSISEGENPPNPSQIEVLCQTLDKLPARTKVGVKIKDFESYREFLPFVNKYSAKFEVFKYVTDFEVITKKVQNDTNKEMTTFKESLSNYLKKSKIDPKITEILQKEIE